MEKRYCLPHIPEKYPHMTIATQTQTQSDDDMVTVVEAKGNQHKVENSLDVMKSFSQERNFCDENGFRKDTWFTGRLSLL